MTHRFRNITKWFNHNLHTRVSQKDNKRYYDENKNTEPQSGGSGNISKHRNFHFENWLANRGQLMNFFSASGSTIISGIKYILDKKIQGAR